MQKSLSNPTDCIIKLETGAEKSIEICLIEQRTTTAALRKEKGHREGDAVVGQRSGKGPVVRSFIEKNPKNDLAFLTPGRTRADVLTTGHL